MTGPTGQDDISWLFEPPCDSGNACSTTSPFDWLDTEEPAWLVEAHDLAFGVNAPTASSGASLSTTTVIGATGRDILGCSASQYLTICGSAAQTVCGSHAALLDSLSVEATDNPT